MSDDHFTAVIEIHKVTFTKAPTTTMHPPSAEYSSRGPVVVPGERHTEEVTRIVVRAKTIEGVITKCKSHLEVERSDFERSEFYTDNTPKEDK